MSENHQVFFALGTRTSIVSDKKKSADVGKTPKTSLNRSFSGSTRTSDHNLTLVRSDGRLQRDRDLPVRVRPQLLAPQVGRFRVHLQQLRPRRHRRGVRRHTQGHPHPVVVQRTAARRLRASGKAEL